MRLERSRTDSKLFGLCGGLARTMNMDSGLLRVIFAVGCILTGGVLLFIYVVASMVVPKERVHEHPGYGGIWYMPVSPAYGFSNTAAPTPPAPSPLDAMMKDMDDRALAREIRDLRAKLARFEEADPATSK